jgi:hypothetical protein
VNASAVLFVNAILIVIVFCATVTTNTIAFPESNRSANAIKIVFCATATENTIPLPESSRNYIPRDRNQKYNCFNVFFLISSAAQPIVAMNSAMFDCCAISIVNHDRVCECNYNHVTALFPRILRNHNCEYN